MKRSRAERAAVTALFTVTLAVWGYLCVGVMVLELQVGETYYASLAASTRRARAEGLIVAELTPDVGQMMKSRYGVTNRDVHLVQEDAATLTEFLEAARATGVVYFAGNQLLAMGRESLLVYSPVIVGRLWPYTVEWVNQ